ncbi:DUF6011 domain-containing protein [Micromonospora fulviviridis]|uniref:DUF6011 domain-containing protein n=1 Tax=Micromonospora fulviviridis TaxID=47860 RepID=UPI0037ADD853
MAEPEHCTVCGRELRTPESRARGIGPVCEAKTRPAPVTLPGLSGRGGQPVQDGPDLLDVDAEDGDR